LAGSVAEYATDRSEAEDGSPAKATATYCVPKALPHRLLLKAAEVAVRENPVNRPAPSFDNNAAGVIEPVRLAVLISKYWGPSPQTLTVSFMEATPADLRNRIILHMNAWYTRIGVQFAFTQGTGNVRISRGGGGYYSYLGTDIKLIPTNRQTMNLQGFTMNTSEAEFKRVVRHETGHTLGFPHEHMRKELVKRLNRAKTIAWFRETYGWDEATVVAQVLTPLNEASLMGTPADQTSIMCYQLPGKITNDGKPIVGGLDINATDYGFAAKIYPKPGHTFAEDIGDGSELSPDDWPESDDPESED
jgi:hypothetical protein